MSNLKYFIILVILCLQVWLGVELVRLAVEQKAGSNTPIFRPSNSAKVYHF